MDSNRNWREELYVMIFQSDTVAGRRFDGILLLIILACWLVHAGTRVLRQAAMDSAPCAIEENHPRLR